jgi:hypothetical protein
MKDMFKKLKIRIYSIWLILTTKNYILIHDIKEYNENNIDKRKMLTTRRTDYSDESDCLTLKATYFSLYDKINPNFNK